MSKYQFNRLGPESFEQMVQALLEPRRRGLGALIQFGPGSDGAREATWTQSPEDPTYVQPANSPTGTAKHWVFQAKFHDIGQRGWRGAADAVVQELRSELEKVTTKHKLGCHHFVLITNVPLSGARRIGSRDRVISVAEDWKLRIANVEVWDAADLSRMLDNNSEVRTAYAELILPGDVISAIYRQTRFAVERRESTFRAYLDYVVDSESKARAEEGGDEDNLSLSKVFIDQTLELDERKIPEPYRDVISSWRADNLAATGASGILPSDLDEIPASFALLIAAQEKMMLLAGPGYGKSTITQFLTLYHASRIVKPELAKILAARLTLPTGWSLEQLDASCEMRFPFRIELRRFAKWRRTTAEPDRRGGLATYIVRELFAKNVTSSLVEDDIFALVSDNPTLLVLDGLDEVPDKEARDNLLKDCSAFVYRCSGEGADLQIVMSSRPQGYNGEFDLFEPLTWQIADLNEEQFDEYCSSWLNERLRSAEERQEAKDRIKRGMRSAAVRQLATTLLQATAMLTIVKKKSDIPEEKHSLFERYVDVVFQREKTKNDLIARYETELMRLHEVVGYRIHEAIGRGEAGNIPEAKFKEFVREVWLLVSGDEQFSGVPNQECHNIFELAKDRLVFLSGKGKNQADIDFVIQPYREYFAAQYLNLHTEADPDKVFICLVERGAFWANVLQFYVALARPAQQLNWALNYEVSEPPTVEQQIHAVQRQRTTLSTLPESVRFTISQFKQAIKSAFPSATLWTWLREDWGLPVLAIARGGEAWRALLRLVEEMPHDDSVAIAFSLWLFPRVIPENAPERARLVALLERWVRIPRFRQEVITTVLVEDLPLALSSEDEDLAVSSFLALPYTRQRKRGISMSQRVQHFSRETRLKFLCSSASRMHGIDKEAVWKAAGLDVEIADYTVSSGALDAYPLWIERPQWVRFGIKRQASLPLDNPQPTPGPCEQYLRALFEALRDPGDPEADRRARALERVPRGRRVRWHVGAEDILGPSPNKFNSLDDWRLYRSRARTFFADEANLEELRRCFQTFGNASAGQNIWCALLFHPNHWFHLVEQGLLSSAMVDEISGTEWAGLMRLPNTFIELGDAVAYRNLEAPPTVPTVQVLEVAAALHQSRGLRDSTLCFALLDLATQASDKAPVENILAKLKDLEDLPQRWATVFITIAARTPGIDSKILTTLWAGIRAGNDVRPWITPVTPKRADEWSVLISNLMADGTHYALTLAAELASQVSEIDPAISSRLNETLVAALSEVRDRSSKIYLDVTDGIFQTRLSVAEVELYADQAWLACTLEHKPERATQIAERLANVPKAVGRKEFPLIRSALEALLSVTSRSSLSIAASALNALIQIDVAERAALEEAMWCA